MSTLHRTILAAALALVVSMSGEALAQVHGEHHAPPPGDGHAAHAGHDPTAGPHPLTAIPPLSDADRAAAFPAVSHAMNHAPTTHSLLLFERLEGWDSDHGGGQVWEAEGWIGGDTRRLWLRSEGERSGGRTDAASLDLMVGRSITPWWDVLAGVRHDFAPGEAQDWVGAGLQGLAPYLVEVSATAWLGGSGRSRLELEAAYDLLLTNRLVLEPSLAAILHGRTDPGRGIGAGLSTVEAGLRLRYEAHRRFAPYLGVTHARAFGRTAQLAADGAGASRETHIVAGIRFWF
jgi:copper resistance protein B